MGFQSRATTVANLKVVAAKAAQMADRLENNQLWPGDLSKGIDEMQDALNVLKRGV